LKKLFETKPKNFSITEMWALRSILFLSLGMILAQAADVIVNCEAGIRDCNFPDDSNSTCAPNNNEYPRPQTQGSIMAVAAIFGLFMAYGIGANDAANSWATCVGSNAISLTKAAILCGFFEWLGATCLGSGVSSTIQKGVSSVDDPDCWACGFCDSTTSVYMSGMMGALIGASVFLLLASLTSMPVSTTHSIVGGVVGMTMAGVGSSCLNWDMQKGLGGIVLSWIISPVLSGAVAAIGFSLSRKFIIEDKNARSRALVLLPFFFSATTFLLVLVTTLKAKAIKKEIELETKYILSVVSAVAIGLFAQFIVVPHIKRTFPSVTGSSKTKDVTGNVEMPKKEKSETEGTEGQTKNYEDSVVFVSEGMKGLSEEDMEQQLDAIWVFRSLLVYNACLESFAHGSNDTANATGAFTAVYQMYTSGESCEKSDSGIWILSVAGIFVALGVLTLGYRVISTIGSKLTEIDFHKGFYIELGSMIATIVATLEGLPVSTTHCQVGAVFAIGLYCKYTNTGTVNFKLLLLIFGGWIITLPLAGGIAALVVTISGAILKK